MELHAGLKKILRKGNLAGELEYQQAIVMDRQLRLLVEEHPELKDDRLKLRDILQEYEEEHWQEEDVTDEQIQESDQAEHIAEQERIFLENRKTAIKERLKVIGLTQKELGNILGHSSVTYMSELVNGINPFTINDLVIINMVLNIDMDLLVPKIISVKERGRIRDVISKLDKEHVSLRSEDFDFA
jgi:transcriptional regulator with XRE-family HTH domain